MYCKKEKSRYDDQGYPAKGVHEKYILVNNWAWYVEQWINYINNVDSWIVNCTV